MSGCELEEITVVDPADVVVAEAYVLLGADPSQHAVRVLLHGADAGGRSDTRTFDDAEVVVTRPGDGLVLSLVVDAWEACVLSQPSDATGTCFTASPALASELAPGDRLELAISLGTGGALSGSLTVPASFSLLDGLDGGCVLPPDTPLEIRWTRSDGAWAYVNETTITGLEAALAPDGIEAEDPLYLLGLSISGTDTTIVFPSEFGVFDRFDLDQDLALRLQRGLPDGTGAVVSIAAVDRNYVNWARGGSFNPSGQVRVASIRGDGSGVFGAAVIRRFTLASSSDPDAGPACPIS